MKQQHPKKLEVAVATILKIESYLNPRARPAGRAVAQVEVDEKLQALVAGVQAKQDAMMEMLTQMMERLEKLEKGAAVREQDQGAGREVARLFLRVWIPS